MPAEPRGGPTHAQPLGGGGNVAAGLLHGIAHQALFLSLADSPERACTRCHPEGGARRIYLDILRRQILRFAQNDSLFNHVLQLPDVAAPARAFQNGLGRIVQPRQRPMVLLRKLADETLRERNDILQRLCQHQGEIVPTQNILLDLWGDDDFFNARSLQVLITRLRGHLSRNPHIRIINVRGTGYKLIVE